MDAFPSEIRFLKEAMTSRRSKNYYYSTLVYSSFIVSTGNSLSHSVSEFQIPNKILTIMATMYRALSVSQTLL